MSKAEQISQEVAERDGRLDHDFTQLHQIQDPDLIELHLHLRKSWEEYVETHAFSLAYDRAFKPMTGIQPRLENAVREIRICTSSEKKKKLLAPIVAQAGYIPVRDIPHSDEDSEHKRLRERRDFPDLYPVRVAASKQSLDLLETPIMTLDTVTFVDGVPMEKPRDLEEAQKMIMHMSGKRVSTETAWIFSLMVRSGASVNLLNNCGITYVMKPFVPEEIVDYAATAADVLEVPVGIDLSTLQARTHYVNMAEPITYTYKNHLAHRGQLTLSGHDFESPLFDALFSGVPIYAIKALLPLIDDIYFHGDPYFVE